MGLPPPGDDQSAPRFASETAFQIAVVRWWNALEILDGSFLFHCPNGGKRDILTASIMQSMGVRRGVADLVIIRPAGNVNWLELKHGDGKLSKDQLEFERTCKRLGHEYRWASTFAGVVDAFRDFKLPYGETLAARLIRV